MKKQIILGAIALVATGAIIVMTGATPGDKSMPVKTTEIAAQDLIKSVSATGNVYSQNSTNVYSELSYPVKTVHVSVGDRVSEGDALVDLDVTGLEYDISQKRAAVSASQATANQSLAAAQSDLATYEKNLANEHDSSVLSAQSALTTAELEVVSANVEVHAASSDLSAARRNLREARDDDAEDDEIDNLSDIVRTKENALEKAQTAQEKALANVELQKKNLEVAEVGSGDSIQTYEDKVKSAQLGTNFNDQWIAIQKMEADLAKAAIAAPVSGTITEVNVIEGSTASGLLFVIQETDSMKIVTNIKEYDIDAVSIGDAVTIKSDATGDKVFTGTLAKIAPTSTQTTSGSVQNSTDVEYEAEVSVDPGADGLRVGMNTRLNIITEERKNTYSVPYEAVATDEAGETVVYIAAPQEDGGYLTQAIPVQTGMETDLHVEILSDALTDGMLVLKSAEGITPDMAVSMETAQSETAQTEAARPAISR